MNAHEQLGRERKVARMLDVLDATAPPGARLASTLDRMKPNERKLLDEAANLRPGSAAKLRPASADTWEALRRAAVRRDEVRAMVPADVFAGLV